LFAIDYKTSKIEKQVKFTSQGVIGFIEKTVDSLYVSFLKWGPGGAGPTLLRNHPRYPRNPRWLLFGCFGEFSGQFL
jgi:hypothetical protein